MKELAASFRYSWRQWGPIAKMLGRYRSDAKAALEEIANRYLASPDKTTEAETFKKRREMAYDIALAIENLQGVLEKNGIDYEIGGESLVAVLSDIVETNYDEADEARRSAPANREDRRRAQYLSEVVRFLREELGSRDRGSVDRVTGKTKERGAIALLLSIANPVLPPNCPLTPESARHALRNYVAPPVQRRQLFLSEAVDDDADEIEIIARMAD